jgi:isoquinoline 1-oxidoreductase subunit beta
MMSESKAKKARSASAFSLDRRKLLIGGGVGLGLVVGYTLWPRQYSANLVAADGEHIFGPWLKIAEDGKIIVAIPQSEMGQGVFTQLAQILAGELGADWRTIAVQPAMTNPLFTNKLVAREWAPAFISSNIDVVKAPAPRMVEELAERRSFVVTAGSSSVRQFERAARESGAIARVLLCQAAAARWDTEWENCETDNGFVIFGKRRLSFAELVVDAAELDPPSPIPLREASTDSLTGRDVMRLDVAAKVDGSANFAGDIRLPDMLYASVRGGPIGDTKLKSFKKDGAKGLRGLVRVIDTEAWIAALASNWWAANSALDMLAPVFETTGKMADSGEISEHLSSRFSKGKGWRLHEVGSVEATMEKEAITRVMKAEYYVAPAVHAPLETRTATAHYQNGRLLLWIATQAPEAAKQAAADAIGISKDNVVLFPMMAGGSFGRNLDNQIAAQAAILTEQTGRPVQVVWSRPEDFMRDHYRAPALAKMSASLNVANQIQGLSVRIAVPSAARELAERLDGAADQEAIEAASSDYDVMAVEGAIPPYTIANLSIDHFPTRLAIPSGRWRGNAHSYTTFFIESFIDELAAKAGVEPLSYRMQMLVGQTRLARCLTSVAALAGWDGGVGGSGKGIACHSMRGGHIALIASASTDESGVIVNRISAAVDVGRIINPDIARQQIEGGIVFGLAQALGASTEFEKGLPLARRLRDINLPLLADVPEIEIEFIRSEEEPGGIGEIAVPVVAPAIANALFSASGVRLRELPLLSNGL